MANPNQMSQLSLTPPDMAQVKAGTEIVKFKNQLQELAHKAAIPLPEYTVINEGLSHSPCFRATVEINGKSYTTNEVFKSRKEAEQEAARLALEDLGGNIEESLKMHQEQWTVEQGHSFLLKLTMFWKSILHEFATKEGGGLPLPSYCTVPAGGTSPYFVSHTKYKEVTYPAMSGRSKKEAEQLAACVTIQTLLGDANSAAILLPIIKSKAKHFSAMFTEDPASSTLVANNSIGTSLGNPVKMSALPLSLAQTSSEKVLVPANPGLNLPIEFVLASEEQNSSSSSRKRRKNRRHAKKRARLNTGIDVNALAQAQSPSVSQPMGVLG